MRAVTVVICGGGEDYDFLLGCLDRHLAYGRVVVLDTTPSGRECSFRLPSSVRWVHRPDYGEGWGSFRFAAALNDALALAEEEGPDVIVQADCDEYFDWTVSHALEAAREAVVEVKTLHHISDREAMDFEAEWHKRLWPARRGIRFGGNPDWVASPHYNGNPEQHPFMSVPEGIPLVREPRTRHHHLHYCLSEKAKDISAAVTTIPGWPDKGARVPLEGCWPIMIQCWRETGERPGDQPFFMEAAMRFSEKRPAPAGASDHTVQRRAGPSGQAPPAAAPPFRSEAAKIRAAVYGRLEGRSVLDIGCGAEKIVPWALGVDDLSESSAAVDLRAGVAPGGDLSEKLGDRLFDVVFSSHALEHIPNPVAETVRHWLKFVRPGGRLILYLPDERHYRYDPANPEAKNPAHRHLLTFDDFMPRLSEIPELKVEEARMDLEAGCYSFLVVAERTG